MATDIADQARIAHLFGETHALATFVRALIRTVPNKAVLAAEFQVASQAGLARIEPLSVLEDTVLAYQALCAEFSSALTEEIGGAPSRRS